MRARASKKEIAARSRLLCKIVRENPGLTVPQIAEKAKIDREKMRPTLMGLLAVETKRGFKMYRKGRRFYTAKPSGVTALAPSPKKPQKKAPRSIAGPQVKKNLRAFDFDKKSGPEFFTATPQELKDADSFKPTDVKKHQEAQKAQQNDEQQLQRWLGPLVRNHQSAKTRLHQAATAIDALNNLGETMTKELHTLREAVLDFLEGGVTINALRQLVGERPKKEGEQ